MFEDRNVNVKQVRWGLVCIYLALFHYAFSFIKLDVLHLENKVFAFDFFHWHIHFVSPVKDFFLFYDAEGPDERMNITWYIYYASMWSIIAIQSYVNLYTYGTLRIFIVRDFARRFRTHQQVYYFRLLCLFFWLYCLLSFILTAGQYLPWWASLAYIIILHIIFYFRIIKNWICDKAGIIKCR